MWWHFRFLFGQTVFLNCLTECQTSCLGFSICLRISNLSEYFNVVKMSLNLREKKKSYSTYSVT
jgi:hypothetical protein